MSEIWSVISSEAVQREPTPRILTEIQDVTSRLCQEFSSSGDPITDDNHLLHRLCVKLEYLLQICSKEKTLLGGDRHYWYWMYDCLRRAKGLSEGLRFVRANKELRTAQGRGRALIRYSLVHQTLADSFQNCLINRGKCLDYLKPMSILMRSAQVAVFLNALYELNAVNFDLISKGYDLDSAWPTFASKIHLSGSEQWRLPTDRNQRSGSIGSGISHFTSVSMLQQNREGQSVQVFNGGDNEYQATASSGAASADHVVEELVLELDESDLRLQRQEVCFDSQFGVRRMLATSAPTQDALKRLEDEANNAAKSAVERQDILARVISDLESRNQTLLGAMEQMSTEFQNREHSWESKYGHVQSQLAETEQSASELKEKVVSLEQDKRTLEETVSTRMTMITSGFSGTDTNAMLYQGTAEREFELAQEIKQLQSERQQLQDNVQALRRDLAAVPSRIEAEKKTLESSIAAKYESREKDWEYRVRISEARAVDSVIERLSMAAPSHFAEENFDALSSDDKVQVFGSKIAGIAREVSDLRRTSSALQEERLLQQSHDEEDALESSRLSEKLEVASKERDDAIIDVNTMREQLVVVNKELQNIKLKHETDLSNLQKENVELKESNIRLQTAVEESETASKAFREEIVFLRQKNDVKDTDLKSFKLKCADLEQQYYERNAQWESENVEAQQSSIRALQETIARLENRILEDENLHGKCLQENQGLKEQVDELRSDIQNRALLSEQQSNRVDELSSSVKILQQEKDAIHQQLALEKSKVHEESQKNSQLSAAIAGLMGGFEKTEKQYQTLNENLTKKGHESAEFQLNAIQARIEKEKRAAEKKYEELSGENESRKRMVSSLEKKLDDLKLENASLLNKSRNYDDIESSLRKVAAEREEFEKSLNETEQELISIAEKLESERVLSLELRKEISCGLEREEKMKAEMSENEAISDELKAKLIQLVQEKDALWKELDELKYFQKLQEDGDDTEARWMEDQEARFCLHCGVEFSIIVRKHHCRVCGKIFCKKCSKQWIRSADGKLERCCLGCLERHRDSNEVKTLTGVSLSPSKSPFRSNTAASSNVSLNDEDFDNISDDEISKTEEQISSSVLENSSIYHTANSNFGEHSSDSISSIPSDENDRDFENEVTISAGDALKLPYDVTDENTVISWKFCTDKNIDFGVSYENSESAEREVLIVKRRCDSHINPVQGEISAKASGIYVLEFDNKFSRFTSKVLKYSIELKKPSGKLKEVNG